MLCNAPRAAPAMFTTQRPSNHAVYAEILLIKLPLLKQLANHCSLFIPATKFWHIPRICDHGIEVEVRRQGEKYHKP